MSHAGEYLDRAVLTVRAALMNLPGGTGDQILRKLDSQGGRSVLYPLLLPILLDRIDLSTFSTYFIM